MKKIKSSEITSHSIYLSRRKFMVGIGAVAAGSALAACGVTNKGTPVAAPTTASVAAEQPTATTASPTAASAVSSEPFASAAVDELGDKLTPYDAVTGYNNFYEFSLNKEKVAPESKDFQTNPWTVEVGGLVHKPQTFDIADLQTKFVQQERIYRMRCVEGWSMVIPWLGFPLAELLNQVEPMSNAKYVRFETLLDPDRMPGQKSRQYDWPYVEGLRVDEAMNDLAILSTGLYGQHLLPQNGAPIRLVVPWKYGLKSIKSIVKIELVEEMPVSLWMAAAGHEYGFYSNVNPEVDHPRWSQATERRIGELKRRETLMFNGYAEEVGHLYTNLDLKKNY